LFKNHHDNHTYIADNQHFKPITTMQNLKLQLLFFLLFSPIFYYSLVAQSSKPSRVDVLHYQVHLEPNLSENSIEGNVTIKFKINSTTRKVVFDCGNLKVTRIEGMHVKRFEQVKNKVIISLSQSDLETCEIQLFYHGKPKRGLVFLNDSQELYSVYFTNEWMICNAAPDDRATFDLDVLVPKDMMSVASGILKETTKTDQKIKYSWSQNYETPSYTYGFTIGTFNTFQHHHDGKHLKYYSAHYTAEEMKKIFQYTGDMISFFEEKSGIALPQDTYSQVLIGNHYQEMSGFAVLKKSYGDLVLKDSTETNLISHELAHQWWGNRITCKNWNHFWLNEGFATFMSAAYNEHRFGKEKYQQNIDSYFNVYRKIKSKGGDKPLVFPNWINPSGDDRNLVYFKGAYVLHLLKEELGNETFWTGIKDFSQTYYGKSVTTKNFQLALERSSNISLAAFFKKWVY